MSPRGSAASPGGSAASPGGSASRPSEQRGATTLPEQMQEAILEHCRRELPNEACGLIAGDAPAARGGRPTRWLPARNAHASPYRYELHPDDLVRLTLEVDDAGEVIWAVVHSHVASPAEPSPTDLREWRYPDALQVVVSLAPGARASLRAWRLADGTPDEVALDGSPVSGAPVSGSPASRAFLSGSPLSG